MHGIYHQFLWQQILHPTKCSKNVANICVPYISMERDYCQGTGISEEGRNSLTAVYIAYSEAATVQETLEKKTSGSPKTGIYHHLRGT